MESGPVSSGGFTDREAFELLAAGMAEASAGSFGTDSIPTTSSEAVGEFVTIAGDDHDAEHESDLDPVHDRADPELHVDSVGAVEDGTEPTAPRVGAGSARGGFMATDGAGVSELPPLVVIPDEQRNHRRNGARGVPPSTQVQSGPGTVTAPVDRLAGSEVSADTGTVDQVYIGRSAATDHATTTSDVEELDAIYEHYAGPVVAVAATMLDDPIAVSHTLYDTFAAVWRAAESFDSVGSKGPWLFTLARRCARTRVRLLSGRVGELPSETYPAPSHRGESVVGTDEVWEAWEVRLALEQLPLSDRSVLRLIHFEGLIHPEIAAELAIPVGTVKSRAYAGSRRLVELLDHVIRPQATTAAGDDMVSALTWYLSGLADGSELGERQRLAIKRIQSRLASAPAWVQPAPAVRTRVARLANRRYADETSSRSAGTAGGGPDSRVESLVRTTVQYDMNEADELFYGRRPHELGPVNDVDGAKADQTSDRRSVITMAMVAVVVFSLAWVGWRSVTGSEDETASFGVGAPPVVPLDGDGRSGSLEVGIDPLPVVGEADATVAAAATETTLVYELMATEIDPEARALVLVTLGQAGAELELQIQQMASTGEDEYLAAWLVNGDEWGLGDPDDAGAESGQPVAVDGAAIPLGSFHWSEGSQDVVGFSGATVNGQFDTLIVTKQESGDSVGVYGPVVLIGPVGS